MKGKCYIVACMLIGAQSFVPVASAQQAPARSHSFGFFVGLGVEGDGVSTHPTQSTLWTKEAGGGAGLVLGYGFTPRWSLYSELSDASIGQDGGGTYSLAHVDLGARVHFRSGVSSVVPFAQLGFSGRRMIQHFPAFPGTSTTESRSAGVGLGAGLNAHFSPAFAFSGSATWTLGDFNTYEINGQRTAGLSWHATSARLHLGLIWFPGA